VAIIAALGGGAARAPGAPAPGAPQAAAPPQAAAEPATAGETAIASGLQAMHRGEYRRALDDFKRAADAEPGSPGPLFYPVFARWWQGLFADGPAARPDSAFDDAYAAAVKVSEARLDETPGDVDALASLGGSQILRAHVEVLRGNYWRSGQEARRGKKALEQALAIDPAREQALFGMGALNYYADRVPLIVKGMRVFFLMPGGDAPLGLTQIRKVADGGGPLRTDGRLLLGMVCADRYQQAYEPALAHLERALGETGGSPLIRAAIGDSQIRLARYGAAAATLESGLAETGGAGFEASRQRRWLALGLAEALAGDWRLDEAEAALGRAAGEQAPSSDTLLRATRRLAAEIAARRGAMTEPDAGPAGANEAGGDDGRVAAGRLLAGRRLIDAGRAAEAVPLLESAADLLPRESPPWLAGSIHLYLGLALKGSGDAAAAHRHFDKAIATRRFRAADRARLELGKKGENAALCAP
jgi:tetratricopeptide (TPR) repeat protein